MENCVHVALVYIHTMNSCMQSKYTTKTPGRNQSYSNNEWNSVSSIYQFNDLHKWYITSNSGNALISILHIYRSQGNGTIQWPLWVEWMRTRWPQRAIFNKLSAFAGLTYLYSSDQLSVYLERAHPAKWQHALITLPYTLQTLSSQPLVTNFIWGGHMI